MKKRYKERKPKKARDDSLPIKHVHQCTRCNIVVSGCICKNSFYYGLCPRCGGKATEAQAIEEIMDIGAIKSIM